MRRIWMVCALLMALTAAVALGSPTTPSSGPTRFTPERYADAGNPGSSGSTPFAARARKHHHPAPGAYLFGDRLVEPNADFNRAGVAESVPVTSGNSGTARSLRVYVGARNHARRVIVGLYSGRKGRPGTLLASGSARARGRDKWVTIGLVARSRGFRSRTIHAGASYWIAVLGIHGSLSFRDRAGGTCRSATSRQRSLTGMPRSWTRGRTRSICRISAYVSGKLVPRQGGNAPVGPVGVAPPTSPSPAPPAAPGLPPIHCDLHATPSTLSTEVSAAATGQTVCLAAGDYGTWSGTNKAITIAPEPNASPTMAFDFRSGAANFTINGGHANFDSNSPGMNVTASSFGAGSQNITLEGVAATDNGASFLIDVRTDGPGIVIRDNIFHDMEYPNTTSGSIRVLTPDSVPASNIVIENNLFRDMGADGIDPYSTATMVGNDFINVGSGSNDPRHTDAIQFFGGPGKLIEGNFVDGCSQGIDAFDGSNGNTLQDNVIIGCTVHSLSTYADTPGSLVARNTVIGRGGEECGAKSGSPASTTQIRDNILQQGINWGGVPCVPSLDTRNMSWTGYGQIHSASDFIGKPVFVGGANPTTYAGYALAAGSPGKGQATDGGDVGARVNLYPRPAGLP